MMPQPLLRVLSALGNVRALAGACLLATGLLAPAGLLHAQSITWKNVQIRGGGFVTGVVFHPTAQNLIYARTDVGGAYRWENSSSTWTPLNDDIGRGDSQLTGILSIAVDPANSNRLYLAAGQYLQSWGRTGAILRSADRGATWARTELSVRLGGNADGRGTGERLVVDPNRGATLYLGTNQDGLWRSTDSGVTWSRVTTFSPSAVTFVVFDKRSGSTGNATQTIYVGVNGSGATLHRSTNGGSSWSAVSGAPANLIPNHADFDTAGTLYVSYGNALGPNGITSGAVWKLATGDGAWTNITPRAPAPGAQFGYGAVAVSQSAPGTLYAATIDLWWPGDEIYRSTNGGASWTLVNNIDSFDGSSAPWVFWHGSAANYNPHWIADLDLDPFTPDRATFVTGGGLWMSTNAFGSSVSWVFRNTGLEETVPLEIASPPSGAPLLSALGDIGGFRHDNLDVSPPVSGYFNPVYGTNLSLDFAQASAAYVVRTHWGAPRGGYSTTGGTSWTDFAARPVTATNNGPGSIAVAANASRIVWIPDNSVPFYSVNNGGSWLQSSGAPAGYFRPVADRVNSSKFYLYDGSAGRVYTSANGAASFSAAASVPGGGGRLRAVFGHEGHLWLPVGANGLRRSTDGGATFSTVSTVQQAWQIGCGQAAPGQTYPALYLSGVVGDVEGIFRSDNIGASWTRVNSDAKRFGWINDITGDPRTYGRVYIATGGRGILYADTAGSGGGSQLIANGTYRIVSRHSGKALEAANAGTADGTHVQQSTYGGGTHQRWTITHLGNNQYRVTCVASGKALDVAGNATADGANVLLWTYGGGNNQRWTITDMGGGYHRFDAVHSGKALDVSGYSTADGAKVHQWTAGTGANQQWSISAP